MRKVPLSELLTSAWPVGLRLGGAFLQLLVTILIGRTLGAEAAGVYFFWAALILETGQVSTFGLDRITVQSLPRFNEGTKEKARFLGAIRTTTLLLSLLLSAGVVAYAAVSPSSEISGWLFLMIPCGVVGVTMCMINQEAAVGLGHPVLAVLYRHTLPTFLIFVGVIVLGEFFTPMGGLAIYSFAFFFTGIAAFFGPGLIRVRPALYWGGFRKVRSHLVQGAPIFFASVCAAIAFMVPLGVLEGNHPTAQVAWVTTAFRIFVLADVLVRAVYSVVLPDLSRATEKLDLRIVLGIYRSTVIKGSIIVGLPVLSLILFAPWIMSMFGEGFEEGAPVLQILLGTGVVLILMGPAHQLLLMLGRTSSLAVLSGIFMVTVVALGLLFVPMYGAIAFAMAFAVGLVLEKFLCLVRALRVAKREAGGGSDE